MFVAVTSSIFDTPQSNSQNKRILTNSFPKRNFGAPADELEELLCKPLLSPVGVLGDSAGTFIPQNALYEGQDRTKKWVLVLCTGGTLTIAPDFEQNGALAPVQGAISRYMGQMDELNQENSEMPDYILHEYFPIRDSSDFGPVDWTTISKDIEYIAFRRVCGLDRH